MAHLHNLSIWKAQTDSYTLAWGTQGTCLKESRRMGRRAGGRETVCLMLGSQASWLVSRAYTCLGTPWLGGWCPQGCCGRKRSSSAEQVGTQSDFSLILIIQFWFVSSGSETHQRKLSHLSSHFVVSLVARLETLHEGHVKVEERGPQAMGNGPESGLSIYGSLGWEGPRCRRQREGRALRGRREEVVELC